MQKGKPTTSTLNVPPQKERYEKVWSLKKKVDTKVSIPIGSNKKKTDKKK